jgi:hypothetical protein
MPPGLRRSLYVRDDDYRYSVLYGSFVTLTDLTDEDWARFAEQRLSPLYISVHATDAALRHQLLGREDIRHALKHKRYYCADQLTAREKRILDNPSLLSRAWMRTGKPVYLFITRRIFGWSDREGAGDRHFD